MPTTIVTKNSVTPAAVPTISDIIQGELAVNLADGAIYSRDDANNIVSLGLSTVGATTNDTAYFNGTNWVASSALTNNGTNVTATGSVTAASFSGDGASVTNVDAATLGGTAASGFVDIVNDQLNIFGIKQFEDRIGMYDLVPMSFGDGGITDSNIMFLGDDLQMELGDLSNPGIKFVIKNATDVIAAYEFDCKNGTDNTGVFTATGDIVAQSNLFNQNVLLCDGFWNFVSLTQAAYDLLTPDANTIYFING